MSRPEGSRPPDLYYDETEARKYNSSSRIINIQAEITERAIEMLNLPEGRPSYVLDVGCGSGLSGEALEEAGHYWVGCDISKSMLEVAAERESETGDILHADMGQGLPFRPGTFDGVISISALQWLCYSESSEQDPKLRLNRFFSSLYSVLKKDAKAVLQFYPENAEQAVLIAQAASKVGFAGGVVIDYPNSSKSKKYYLCLSFERAFKVCFRAIFCCILYWRIVCADFLSSFDHILLHIHVLMKIYYCYFYILFVSPRCPRRWVWTGPREQEE